MSGLDIYNPGYVDVNGYVDPYAATGFTTGNLNIPYSSYYSPQAISYYFAGYNPATAFANGDMSIATRVFYPATDIQFNGNNLSRPSLDAGASFINYNGNLADRAFNNNPNPNIVKNDLRRYKKRGPNVPRDFSCGSLYGNPFYGYSGAYPYNDQYFGYSNGTSCGCRKIL
jgi:hypothetical protein